MVDFESCLYQCVVFKVVGVLLVRCQTKKTDALVIFPSSQVLAVNGSNVCGRRRRRGVDGGASSSLLPTHKHKHTLYHPCRLSAFHGLQGVCSICLSAGVPVTVSLSRQMTRQRQEKVGGKKTYGVRRTFD